ncbi:MAG: hypothetical protein JO041_04410 [Acidobacteria bacterium]|nr:hypothetical protein [Acidobacteriota bacterium]
MKHSREHARLQLSAGFSLIELLMAITVLIIVAGAAFGLLAKMQQSHGSTTARGEMHAGVRSATELLIQEIGQAGAVSFPASTLSAVVTGSSTAQTVAVSSNSYMFVGENVLVDAGSSKEIVALTAVGSGTISGVFTMNHASAAVVAPVGVFAQGILSSSNSTQLRMIGDINNDGTLVLVEYDCVPPTLTRSITPITNSTKNTPDTLLDNLVANPGGTACFTYQPTVASAGFNFIPGVGLTLSTQTTVLDPVTGTNSTMTKSFLNLAPRNVLAGVTLAGNGNTDHIQPAPASLPQ